MIAVPMLLSFADAGLLVFDHFHQINTAALLLAGLAIGTVILRMGLTFIDNVGMLRGSESEALTDSLTSIGNRRKLREDLEKMLSSREDGYLLMFDLDGFKSYNDSFGHPAGDALLERLGRALSEAAGSATAYRMGGDEFCLMGRSSDCSLKVMEAKGRAALTEKGDGFNISSSFGSVQIETGTSNAAEILREADLRMYAEKNGRRESAARQTSEALLVLLAERNPELREHTGSVADFASMVARCLEMQPTEVEEVRLAAQLHDVGKAAIPDRILKNPGPLDDEEWHFMRQHTIIGERIVAAAPSLRGVSKLVRSSHEAFDGTGYPDKLAGDQIPLGAQIVAVADAFDAMTSDRPYRQSISPHEAVLELERCSGTQFAPRVVDALTDVLLERSLSSTSLQATRHTLSLLK